MSSLNGSEEYSVWKTKYWHNKCSVQIVVPHFAGGLSYQRAAVAGSAVKPAALQTLTRNMLGTDWIIRAEPDHPECWDKLLLDVACLLN